ncbi:Hypothetical protein NocV09_00700250, partial [Nannochloropsis oceanica]
MRPPPRHFLLLLLLPLFAAASPFSLTLGPSNLSLSLSLTPSSVDSSSFPPSLNASITLPLSHIGFKYHGRFLCPPHVDAGTGGVVQGGLVLHAMSEERQGWDRLGEFVAWSLEWQVEEKHETIPVFFQTNIRVYVSSPLLYLIAFEQVFPQGTEGSASLYADEVISSFPAFATGPDSEWEEYGFLTYAHNMACAEGVLFCTPVGRMGGRKEDIALLSDSTGQQGGVPLVLFPPPSPPPPPPPPLPSTSHQTREGGKEGRRKGQPPLVILSPLDNFMAMNVFFENRSQVLQYGVQGKVNSLPPGFSSTTLLSLHLHSSPTLAVEEWGGVLRSYYGTRKEGGREGGREEVTKDYLSYYTDNGAYYYYLTEENKGRDNGTSTWEAKPDVFPSGLEGFQSELQLPLIAHNRWWSVETPYACQNGGNYSFVVERRQPLPPSLPPPLGAEGTDRYDAPSSSPRQRRREDVGSARVRTGDSCKERGR